MSATFGSLTPGTEYTFSIVAETVAGVGTAATAPVTVPVVSLPLVTLDPESKTVAAGDIASFTAAALGEPTPSVRWQSFDGTTWSDIGGATDSTYSFTTVATDDGRQYRALFSNTHGDTATEAATLTVHFAPTVTVHPQSQTAALGDSVTFSAAATGNPTPYPRWQIWPKGGTNWVWLNSDGSTSFSITATQEFDGAQFRAEFSNYVNGDFQVTHTDAALLTILAGWDSISNDITELRQAVVDLDLASSKSTRGLEKTLLSLLDSASTAAADQDAKAVTKNLEKFISTVQSQSGKKLVEADATMLVTMAQDIVTAIGQL